MDKHAVRFGALAAVAGLYLVYYLGKWIWGLIDDWRFERRRRKNAGH